VDYLKRKGFNILQARNGKEALEIIVGTGHTMRAIITDVIMPEMGGLELARTVRGAHPTLPVIFVSGYTDRMISLNDLAGKEWSLLHKPFRLDDLMLTLARHKVV
jgi:DNA-binding NtrC family response regulator